MKFNLPYLTSSYPPPPILTPYLLCFDSLSLILTSSNTCYGIGGPSPYFIRPFVFFVRTLHDACPPRLPLPTPGKALACPPRLLLARVATRKSLFLIIYCWSRCHALMDNGWKHNSSYMSLSIASWQSIITSYLINLYCRLKELCSDRPMIFIHLRQALNLLTLFVFPSLPHYSYHIIKSLAFLLF
jgi:hypothetical protein